MHTYPDRSSGIATKCLSKQWYFNDSVLPSMILVFHYSKNWTGNSQRSKKYQVPELNLKKNSLLQRSVLQKAMPSERRKYYSVRVTDNCSGPTVCPRLPWSGGYKRAEHRPGHARVPGASSPSTSLPTVITLFLLARPLLNTCVEIVN